MFTQYFVTLLELFTVFQVILILLHKVFKLFLTLLIKQFILANINLQHLIHQQKELDHK